jgi:uncharacterized protein (TIGR03086 family)
MPAREHLESLLTTVRSVIVGVSDDDIGASTPCTDWDVRTVVNHMLGTVEAMRRVGAAEDLDPDDPWGTQGNQFHGEWRRDLSDLLAAYVEAWSRPDAWEGEAMGGAMPKRTIGDMGYAEVMLHGWDLAKGSGQDVEYDAPAVEQALEVMARIGETGRQHTAFGPEVPVPDDAPPFDKVLAQAGRDPEWSRA